MELQGKPDPTEAEQAELDGLEREWSNHWLTDRQDIPSRAAIAEGRLLEAIEDQRAKLYNVEGSLRCLIAALQSMPGEEEIEGAVELAADEVDRVNCALDRVNLLRAANADAEAVEGARPASAEEVQP